MSMSSRTPLINTFVQHNSQINLSAIRTPADIFLKHITDSIELTKIYTIPDGITLCDLGTGGGFPLLPLAIQYPWAHFVGVDGIRKKTLAIASMATQLWLTNVEVLRSRGEHITTRYDILTARAVTYSDILLPLTSSLVHPWGRIILYKLHTHEEDTLITQWCRTHRATLLHRHLYQLTPDDVQRVIYIIQTPLVR